MATGSSLSSSAPLSSEDAQTLHLYGRDISQDAFAVIWETLLISAYGVFFAVAIYSIFRKGFKSPSSIAMLCAIVSLYTSCLTLWALGVTLWFQNAHLAFMGDPEIPLMDRKALVNDNIYRFGTQKLALYLFNMVVADCVVIWRVWALYPRALWVISVPCITLLTAFSFGVVDVTCDFAKYIHHLVLPDGGQFCSDLVGNVAWAWAFSLVTNVTCTILIGYRAWQYRRTMKSLHIVGHSRRMSADKVLSILVESGFIYCLLWLPQMIDFFEISRNNSTIYIECLTQGLGNQITGMYPTLIISIVNFKQTIWENDAVSTIQFVGQSKSGSRDIHIDRGDEAESTGELM